MDAREVALYEPVRVLREFKGEEGQRIKRGTVGTVIDGPYGETEYIVEFGNLDGTLRGLPFVDASDMEPVKVTWWRRLYWRSRNWVTVKFFWH